jgi:hypothetical protein
LKSQLGVDSALVEGDRGEFSVWVDGSRVSSKQGDGFPSDDEVVRAVRSGLEKAST